jgi:hypothetical protein
MNEQILNALEILDPTLASELNISIHGNLRVYSDGHSIFSWKGKDIILFEPVREVDGKFNLYAHHNYETTETSTSFGDFING